MWMSIVIFKSCMPTQVRENFPERSEKSRGILESWNAGHPEREITVNIKTQLLYILRVYGTGSQMVKVIDKDLLYTAGYRGMRSFPDTSALL